MSPQPARQPMWTCHCGTQNEAFRTTCRNQSQHGATQPTEES
jgi:hypothetical protein